MSTQNQKKIKVRVQNKHDIEANWEKADGFIPLDGETIVYDVDETHDRPRVKMGDGKTVVTQLPFIADDNHKHDIASIDGLQLELDTLDAKVAALMYKEIDITSFTNNVGTVELGSTVTSVTVNWSVNKEPETLTLAGNEIDTSLTSYTYDEVNITNTTSYTLVATDEKAATKSKTTTMYFYNGVYYGSVSEGTAVDSAMILSLERKLQSGKGITFTTVADSNQYIVLALPVRYGEPTFNVGGFDGGFTLIDTISFTNASGYTEDYYVYFSDNVGLGKTTVKVS